MDPTTDPHFPRTGKLPPLSLSPTPPPSFPPPSYLPAWESTMLSLNTEPRGTHAMTEALAQTEHLQPAAQEHIARQACDRIAAEGLSIERARVKPTNEARVKEARRAYQARLNASRRANTALTQSLADSGARLQRCQAANDLLMNDYKAMINDNGDLKGRLRRAKAEIHGLRNELQAIRRGERVEISSPLATHPVTRSRPAARQPVVVDLTISEDESEPDVTGTPGVDSPHVRILLRSPICGIDLARRLRLRSTRERNNHTAHAAKDKELKKGTWNAKVIDRR
ncbi:hypothetical protein BDV93DRAFT_558449 [Ceratobasidium sp. AG-I]|nr:hypothetical protein BDV93DRAFT_558449 [Ceratobasidium sp. AG-I]